MFFNEKTGSVFVMPKDVLKYASGAKKSELKVIMYLFSTNGSFDINDAVQMLGESAESINSALAFWRGTGIISECGEAKESAQPEKAKESLPANKSVLEAGDYTLSDVAKARSDDADFRSVAEFTEKTTGELLNSSKLASLFYLYDSLGMQSDVIMGIVAHCCSQGKNKIRYIVKTAEGIHNDGVESYKELENYFAANKRYAEYETAVKKVIGAGERALTPSEKKLVKTWEEGWKIDKELLPLAYERTIALISKPSLPYMSKILENWHNEGIETAEQAKKYLADKSSEIKNAKNEEKLDKAKKAGFDIEFEDIFEKP